MKNVTYNILDWLKGGRFIMGYRQDGTTKWSVSNAESLGMMVGFIILTAAFILLWCTASAELIR